MQMQARRATDEELKGCVNNKQYTGRQLRAVQAKRSNVPPSRAVNLGWRSETFVR